MVISVASALAFYDDPDVEDITFALIEFKTPSLKVAIAEINGSYDDDEAFANFRRYFTTLGGFMVIMRELIDVFSEDIGIEKDNNPEPFERYPSLTYVFRLTKRPDPRFTKLVRYFLEELSPIGTNDDIEKMIGGIVIAANTDDDLTDVHAVSLKDDTLEVLDLTPTQAEEDFASDVIYRAAARVVDEHPEMRDYFLRLLE